MAKTLEEIRTDLEIKLAMTAEKIDIDTSKTIDEIMDGINKNFNAAIKEYMSDLLKRFPEKDSPRKAAELTMAYNIYERDMLSLDVLAEMIFMVLMTE